MRGKDGFSSFNENSVNDTTQDVKGTALLDGYMEENRKTWSIHGSSFFERIS